MLLSGTIQNEQAEVGAAPPDVHSGAEQEDRSLQRSLRNNGRQNHANSSTSIKSIKKLFASVLPMSSKKRQAEAHVVSAAQQNRGDNVHPASVARASSPRRLRNFLSGEVGNDYHVDHNVHLVDPSTSAATMNNLQNLNPDQSNSTVSFAASAGTELTSEDLKICYLPNEPAGIDSDSHEYAALDIEALDNRFDITNSLCTLKKYDSNCLKFESKNYEISNVSFSIQERNETECDNTALLKGDRVLQEESGDVASKPHSLVEKEILHNNCDLLAKSEVDRIFLEKNNHQISDNIYFNEDEEMKRRASNHLPNTRKSWPPGSGRETTGPPSMASSSIGHKPETDNVDSLETKEKENICDAAIQSRDQNVSMCSHDMEERIPSAVKAPASLINSFDEYPLNRVIEESICNEHTLLKIDCFDYSTPKSVHVLEWLETEAPTDVLPRILSFAGSRKLLALCTVNKKWRDIVLNESIWRSMCEDTGKWRVGEVTPKSWLNLYKRSPCVPIDYHTIESAMASCTEDDKTQHESCRILLYPAVYTLQRPIVVHARGLAQVTIESLDVSPRYFINNNPKSLETAIAPSTAEPSSNVAPSGRSRRMKTPSKLLSSMRRSILSSCQNSDAADPTAHSEPIRAGIESDVASVADEVVAPPVDEARYTANHNVDQKGALEHPRRAKLVFKTRKHNMPVVHVFRGRLNMSNIDLRHDCYGTDIWNGNTAVQVQPPFNNDGTINQTAAPDMGPEAILENLDIYSKSGRGVVSIDGGSVTVRSCHVHHCAATGVYIGGPGSQAIVERSDVLYNGKGNIRPGRGQRHGVIARGHSGIYLEQGIARITDSNVSHNSLTGISAISTDNAFLTVEDSDLVANGTIQIEMPPEGTRSFRRSVTRNNVTRPQGLGRSRSTILARDSELRREEPQSPSSDLDGPSAVRSDRMP